MKHPLLTLTRNRQIGAACWGLVLLAQLCSLLFPIRGLPFPLKVSITILLLAAVVVMLITTTGLWTEKGDERATENERRTNAALSTCFFLVMAFLLFRLKEGAVLTLTREWLVVLFSGVCLVKELLFLVYERFGR